MPCAGDRIDWKPWPAKVAVADDTAGQVWELHAGIGTGPPLGPPDGRGFGVLHGRRPGARGGSRNPAAGRPSARIEQSYGPWVRQCRPRAARASTRVIVGLAARVSPKAEARPGIGHTETPLWPFRKWIRV